MKIDRLVSMIMLLLDKKRMGAQELADTFEVSLRTVYRDMDTINRAGIPVLSTPGVGGGFEIMQTYKIDRKVFSTAELSAILMGLSNLSNMIRGSELVSALAKVRRFIPAGNVKDIEIKANQILIDLSPWLGNKNIQPFLETIQTALQESRLLSFDYADQSGHKTTRTAEPYKLVLKGSHWYWHGYCRLRNDFRLFKLSRTSKLSMLEESFIPREAQEPQLRFDEVLETMQTRILLRVHQSIMDRVCEFCMDEDISPDGDTHCMVHFPFIENEYHYNVLLGYGDKCECVEPPHIRAEMKRRLQNIAALYESEHMASRKH